MRSDVVEVLLLGNGGALVEGWLDGNLIDNDKMVTNLDDRQSSHGLLSFSLLGRIECRKRAGQSRSWSNSQSVHLPVLGQLGEVDHMQGGLVAWGLLHPRVQRLDQGNLPRRSRPLFQTRDQHLAVF